MSFVSEASVPAQRNLYGEEDRIQRSGFLICFGKNVKDGELFANFFDGNEKETTLDEKNTLIMRRLALKLDLTTHSFVTGTAKEEFRLSFLTFFFCFTVDLGKTFGMGELVRLGS